MRAAAFFAPGKRPPSSIVSACSTVASRPAKAPPEVASGLIAMKHWPVFGGPPTLVPKVLASIENFSKGYMGQVWKPAPLLVKLAKEGRKFND